MDREERWQKQRFTGNCQKGGEKSNRTDRGGLNETSY